MKASHPADTDAAGVLRQRQQQVEDELAQIKRELAKMTTTKRSSELVDGTTSSTCDSPEVPNEPQQKRCPAPGVPYGSMDNKPTELSPLFNHVLPDHIAFGNGDHHEWEECFSHVRSEEDLDNEKVINESEFYLKSSMWERGAYVTLEFGCCCNSAFLMPLRSQLDMLSIYAASHSGTSLCPDCHHGSRTARPHYDFRRIRCLVHVDWSAPVSAADWIFAPYQCHFRQRGSAG